MQMHRGPQCPLRAYTAENIYFYFLDAHLQEHTKGKQHHPKQSTNYKTLHHTHTHHVHVLSFVIS